MVAVLLLFAAFVALVVGALSLSSTFGLGLIGVAGVLGIFARISQADAHHKATIAALKGEARQKSRLDRQMDQLVEQARR